jgi:hypothetical protein
LDLIGNWRYLHNEELHNIYSSPNIVRMITSRRMRWAGRVESMGEKRDSEIFGFHNKLGISYVAEQMLTAQVGLTSMDLIS